MKRTPFKVIGLLFAVFGISGCARHTTTVVAAPPIAPPTQMGAPMGGSMGNNQNVFDWTSVPANQQVPVNNASFDLNGYQLYTQEGTIVVPFANQNMYVMKFGRANSTVSYFENDGNTPTLYLAPGAFLTNAAANGARWYPIPDNFQYVRPMYVALAPSWNDYVSMGWYPGMVYNGGLWGYSYRPGIAFNWMPGFSVNIGGRYYRNYTTYHTYYTRTPGFTTTRSVYSYRPTSRSFGGFNSNQTGSFNGNRSLPRRATGGTSGSFGGSFQSAPAGSTRSSGSFGNSRTFQPTPSSGTRSSGSFGNSGGSGFNSGATPRSGSSFNSQPRGFGGSTFQRPSGKSSFGGSSGARPSFGGGGGFGRSSGSFGRRR